MTATERVRSGVRRRPTSLPEALAVAIVAGALAVVAAGCSSDADHDEGVPERPSPRTTTVGGVLRGTVELSDKTWKCKGPVDLELVRVTMHQRRGKDAVHLSSGCTGSIERLEVIGTAGDGVKVHAGAHDLTIRGGRIDCGPRAPGKHQDAIQAMGGLRITFEAITSTGCANSFMFINAGKKRREFPTQVVCRGCEAATRNYSVSVRNSIRSGAVGGSFTSRVPPWATDAAIEPVLTDNRWSERPPDA